MNPEDFDHEKWNLFLFAEYLSNGGLRNSVSNEANGYDYTGRPITIGDQDLSDNFFPFIIPELRFNHSEFILPNSADSEYMVQYQPNPELNGGEAVMHFYGLNEEELSHLFIAGLQKPQIYGGVELAEDATPQEVAANIISYIQIYLGIAE